VFFVDPHAEVIRVERDPRSASRGSRPRSAKCMSMSSLGASPSPGPVRNRGAETLRALAAEIIVRPMAVAPRAGAGHDQAPAELLAEDVVGPRADQGQDAGLVAAAEEHPRWNPEQRRGGRVQSASARPRSLSSRVCSTPSLRKTRSYSACNLVGDPGSRW